MTILSKITRHLVHTVDVVRISHSNGVRSESTTEDVAARITNRSRYVRDEAGDRIVSKTVVWFEPDADVLVTDEIIADGVQHPIEALIKAREGNGVVHHLEAFLS